MHWGDHSEKVRWSSPGRDIINHSNLQMKDISHGSPDFSSDGGMALEDDLCDQLISNARSWSLNNLIPESLEMNIIAVFWPNCPFLSNVYSPKDTH